MAELKKLLTNKPVKIDKIIAFLSKLKDSEAYFKSELLEKFNIAASTFDHESYKLKDYRFEHKDKYIYCNKKIAKQYAN